LDINNDARSQGFDTREPFIVPIFLIRKENVKNNSSNFKALEAISDITWQVESDDFNSSQRALAEKFINHRSYLESQYRARDYFLIPIGIIKKAAGDVPMPFMSIFESIDDYKNEIDDLSSESTTTNSLQRKNIFQITLYKILEYMRENYNYIYLPAEITTSEYSKIESELLQSLLGENLQQKISKIIKKKDIADINKYLNEFVEQLSTKLNGKYHFKKPTQRQNSFTQRHMITKIIESYFSDKILHYIDNINRDIPVHNLSSGEKRKALLDLSIGFLKGNPKKVSNQPY